MDDAHYLVSGEEEKGKTIRVERKHRQTEKKASVVVVQCLVLRITYTKPTHVSKVCVGCGRFGQNEKTSSQLNGGHIIATLVYTRHWWHLSILQVPDEL